jgi:hypothetical protein
MTRIIKLQRERTGKNQPGENKEEKASAIIKRLKQQQTEKQLTQYTINDYY